jgi:hypothetical protein
MSEARTGTDATSTAKHTPGPFEMGVYEGKAAFIYAGPSDDPTRFLIGEVSGDEIPAEEAIANGRLFTAAPDLLTELRDVEWAGLEEDPDGGYYAACPSCGGGDPHNPATPETYAGHLPDCTLAAALAKATAETDSR